MKAPQSQSFRPRHPGRPRSVREATRGERLRSWVSALLLVVVALLAGSPPARAQGDTNELGAGALEASAAARTNLMTLTSMDGLDDVHRLSLGDKVSLRIVEDQEDAKGLLVKDSGQIDVPYIGLVTATNKTCKSLAKEIKEALEKEYYYQATVIIALDQYSRSRGKIYLTGAIQSPGPQEMPGDEAWTVSKAIMRAGGFKEFADQRRVKVTRRIADDTGRAKLLQVDVSEVIEKGRMEKDLEVKPGDLIYVPTRLVNF